jgi:AcrR family transcriptional regulator
VIDEGTSRSSRPGRRDALVAAAFQRLASQGFEGLRTRDVAADVGVNIATLHYYFPTKEALIRGVIGHAMQRFMTTMPHEGTAVDQLRGHLQAVLVLVKSDQQLWAVMGELVLRAPRDAELERIFRETDAYWRRTLGELIQRCVDDGLLVPLLAPHELAALMIVAIKGLSLPAVGGFQPDLADRVFRQFDHLLGLSDSAD